MKQGLRILAINDSPFRKGAKSSLLIGVVGRKDAVEGVMSFKVSIDGTDSTESILRSITSSRFRDQIRIVSLNGNTVAGTNVVDICEISSRLSVPVLAITRKKPHPADFKKAIRKATPAQYRSKAALLDRVSKSAKISRMSGFYVQHVGIGKKDAASFLETSIKLLRLAHLIASGVSRGESHGRI